MESSAQTITKWARIVSIFDRDQIVTRSQRISSRLAETVFHERNN